MRWQGAREVAGLPSALQRHPELDGWVRIDPADTVTVATGKVELGQGITTALALIAAHELSVDVARIRVQTAHTGLTPNEFVTAGSMSVQDSGGALRQACAHARRLLIAAATAALGADSDGLDIRDGWIAPAGASTGGNEGVSIWALQGGRRFEHTITEHVDERPALAPPPRQRRIDLDDKIRGVGVFVQDMAWPDMLHARVVRPPSWRHRLDSISLPHAIAGIDMRVDGSLLAVVGEDEYRVVRTAEIVAGRCRWRLAQALTGEPLGGRSRSFPVRDGVAVDEPVTELAFQPDLRATYHRPHLMHAALAPSAAAALWHDGKLTVWTHSQGVELLRHTLADVLGIAPEAVTVIHRQGAGAYGHNGADDAALDAALCARPHPGRPVLLKWTRAQEHAWEPYGPAMRVDLAAALDDAGRIAAWSHDVWSYTHAGRPIPGETGSNLSGAWLREASIDMPPAAPRLGPEVGIHRNAWPIYALPEPRVVKRFVAPGPLRTSSLRGLGAHGNVFAIESFMDELAQTAGADPLSFRLRHLADDRARSVLEAVVDLAGGLSGPRGLALARYKNRQTWAAVVAEVDVDPQSAAIRVGRLWIAADAGRVVDPDGLINQLEGGAVQSLSWSLKEAVEFDADGICSVDWQTYPVLRFDEMPEVATSLIDRPDKPSLGAGEATVGPAAAALANAVVAATGLRVRDLPLTPERLREAAGR
jgi:nicotinate dehydrogenase subunit B